MKILVTTVFNIKWDVKRIFIGWCCVVYGGAKQMLTTCIVNMKWRLG